MSRRPTVVLSGGTAPGRHEHRDGTACTGFTALDGRALELSWDRERAVRDPRAAAAAANDVLMVHGITSTFALDCEPCRPVREVLRRHYAQVFSLRPPPAAGPVAGLLSCSTWSRRPARVTPGRAVGVNIGQSYVKAVAVRAAGAVAARERRPSGAGPGHGADLTRSVMRLLSELGAGDPDVAAIGISTGGIVTGAAIWPGSGITAGLDRAGCDLVRALPSRVAEAFGKPVLVVQDVKAKAYFHAATSALSNALVLDVGTSVGGCHVDRHGRIPTLLNQVGRVAFDLSPDAPARPDGQGTGLLSQYLSATGLVRHLRRHGFPVGSPVDLEGLFARDRHGAAEAAREFLADHLVQAAGLLRGYYEFDRVVVTGGLAANRAIDLAGAVGERTPPASVAVTNSPEPVFDSCIGAAYGALARADR